MTICKERRGKKEGGEKKKKERKKEKKKNPAQHTAESLRNECSIILNVVSRLMPATMQFRILCLPN
jgi:hypothetical protein